VHQICVWKILLKTNVIRFGKYLLVILVIKIDGQPFEISNTKPFIRSMSRRRNLEENYKKIIPLSKVDY